MSVLINPILVKTGKSKVAELSNLSMNYAVAEVMKGTIAYDDLIHLVTDSGGKITMLQANSILINSISQSVVDATYKSLFKKLEDPLRIPLGSFTGIPILSGIGPNINIDMVPYGNIICKFLSKFISAGINQTHHKIYIEITANVTIVLPLTKLSVETKSEALICESLIIGEVPETFLMAEQIGDMLNLVG